MPPAEVHVDTELVRALLEVQHPDLAGLPLRRVGSGWDNAIFRLGDDLAVRLPRRAAAAHLLEHERRWLPKLAERLPLAVSVPLRTGRPGPDFPWTWTISAWLPGDIAALRPPDDPSVAASELGAFLRALHRRAPSDAPRNPYRGTPLVERAAAFEHHLRQLERTVDVDRARAEWHAALDTPAAPGPPVWLHGDLHPANVLVHAGRVSAVIDFGDLTAGDRATDLAVAWMMFGRAERERFRAAAGGVDDDTWTRARGWALCLALAYVANSADNEVVARIGRSTLEAVLAG